MNKKLVLKIGIAVFAAIIVIILIISAIKWKKNAPIRLVKKYISMAEEGNIKKMKEMFDFKGWYAWNECDENAQDFNKEYKHSSEDKAENLIDDWGYNDKEEFLESFMYDSDNITYTIRKEPTMKKLDKNLYQVKVKLKIDDDGYDFNETWSFIIYKNRIIYLNDID